MKIIENSSELNESYFKDILENKAGQYNEMLKAKYDADDDHYEWLVDEVLNTNHGVLMKLADGSEIRVVAVESFGAKATFKLFSKEEEEDFLVALNDDDVVFEKHFAQSLLAKLKQKSDNVL